MLLNLRLCKAVRHDHMGFVMPRVTYPIRPSVSLRLITSAADFVTCIATSGRSVLALDVSIT